MPSVSPKARATLRHPGTWAALAIALLLIAPNLIWNAGHQFATFEHTRENANWNGRFPNILGLLAFLGTQIAIAGPVLFAAFMIAAVGRAPEISREIDGDRRRLLLAMSLPVFLLIAAQALISKANGNWAATGFPAATILAVAAMLILEWRRGMIFTLALSVVLLFGISFAGSFAGAFTSGPIGRELGKMVGWGDFAGKVRELADKNGLKTVVFISRGLTASMIYELRDSGLDIRAYVANPKAPGDHFEMTRPWSPADRGPVLLVFAGGEAAAGRRGFPRHAGRPVQDGDLHYPQFRLDGVGLPRRLTAPRLRVAETPHKSTGCIAPPAPATSFPLPQTGRSLELSLIL